jgi:hypothetical protein
MISETLLKHVVVCNHFDGVGESFIDCWFETFCNTESKYHQSSAHKKIQYTFIVRPSCVNIVQLLLGTSEAIKN